MVSQVYYAYRVSVGLASSLLSVGLPELLSGLQMGKEQLSSINTIALISIMENDITQQDTLYQ